MTARVGVTPRSATAWLLRRLAARKTASRGWAMPSKAQIARNPARSPFSPRSSEGAQG